MRPHPELKESFRVGRERVELEFEPVPRLEPGRDLFHRLAHDLDAADDQVSTFFPCHRQEGKIS